MSITTKSFYICLKGDYLIYNTGVTKFFLIIRLSSSHKRHTLTAYFIASSSIISVIIYISLCHPNPVIPVTIRRSWGVYKLNAVAANCSLLAVQFRTKGINMCLLVNAFKYCVVGNDIHLDDTNNNAV